MEIHQIEEYDLMERAGAGAFEVLQDRYPKVRHIAVFCGSGKNAGDGYILARLLRESGKIVTVFPVKPTEALPEPAAFAASLALDAGVFYQEIDDTLEPNVELIVDALLGTGMHGNPHGLMAAAIHQINDSGLPILALDVPSGLDAETGKAGNTCVRADITVTFIAPKKGLYLLDGPDYSGDIQCCDLGLQNLIKRITPEIQVLQGSDYCLPSRKKNSHKGDYGHVLIIGGGPGMPGAAGLAAKACLRAGAGAVSIALWPEYANSALVSLIPEAMFHGIENPDDLDILFEKATVCIVGPGLGDTSWAESLFEKAMSSSLPMVIDASALHFLAAWQQPDDNWVLTPHPGEAAALLQISTANVQNNRYESIQALQKQYGGVVVLKGSGTLIQGLNGDISLCQKGNPGMATAGMGDVLTGIIAALIAQGCDLSTAARLGVWTHATAADRLAARFGERGLLAGDVADIIPSLLNDKIL